MLPVRSTAETHHHHGFFQAFFLFVHDTFHHHGRLKRKRSNVLVKLLKNMAENSSPKRKHGLLMIFYRVDPGNRHNQREITGNRHEKCVLDVARIRELKNWFFWSTKLLSFNFYKGQAIFEDRAARSSHLLPNPQKQETKTINQSINQSSFTPTRGYEDFHKIFLFPELKTIWYISDDENSHLIPQSIPWTLVKSKKKKNNKKPTVMYVHRTAKTTSPTFLTFLNFFDFFWNFQRHKYLNDKFYMIRNDIANLKVPKN